ncbi:MAG: hypothetical protein COA54_10925 [Thiotrichaceae bacterium]|nr:MAG: hypothetical protein COA54_10925 [Thiotrichaceae bacterium]
MTDIENKDYDYDVCFSFAGEDREYVSSVAEVLRDQGIRVFYDEYEEVELWGKDLYVHLDDVYKNAARYCVLFISDNYSKKLWTNHERKSAQERAFKENTEYILPARFDDTPIPGLRDTVGYIDISQKSPEDFSELIIKKVGGHWKNNYFPPVPDSLYKSFNVEDDEDEKEEIYLVSHHFFLSLKRMSEDEKNLVFHFFNNACPAELPENMHVNIDLLRRITGFTPSRILRLFSGMKSLGFESFLRDDNETEGHIGNEKEMLVVSWSDYTREDSTKIAFATLYYAQNGYCETHAIETLQRLDFSQLSKVTYEDDIH